MHLPHSGLADHCPTGAPAPEPTRFDRSFSINLSNAFRSTNNDPPSFINISGYLFRCRHLYNVARLKGKSINFDSLTKRVPFFMAPPELSKAWNHVAVYGSLMTGRAKKNLALAIEVLEIF
jgi:hypothetical protein